MKKFNFLRKEVSKLVSKEEINHKFLLTNLPTNLLTRKRCAFTLAEGATHVGNSNRDRKAAFTLAEVLITLGIIGVVAAVVMPTVITKVQDHVFANQLLSNYSKITNVIERWQVDNDCLGNARGCLEMYKSQGAKNYYDPSVARDMFKDLVYFDH